MDCLDPRQHIKINAIKLVSLQSAKFAFAANLSDFLVLKPNQKQAEPPKDAAIAASLHLLLFVDDRSNSQKTIQEIQGYLQSQAKYPYELQVIEIGEQPHLVEHFRLMATPALVKLDPEPRQTLAGSNLISQLKKWWFHWQSSIEQERQHQELPIEETRSSVNHSAEVMRLSDEIFRLKQEKEELLEQLRFKDHIVAMLAHDLRSPLTAASIAVETLELIHEQPDKQRSDCLKKQLFGQARHQFQVANQMIADLLEASRNVSAKLQVEPEQLNLKSLCREILPQITKQLREKSQVFQKDIPQDLPTVFADRELIRQVIINLLENALKYTPPGGEIKLSILHRTTQKVQVSVCDTGLGIPEEKQERIFDGHFRLQRDEAEEGYGLGLSLCRKIIQVHYGRIWVDSSPNQGSCFHFTLPIYR